MQSNMILLILGFIASFFACVFGLIAIILYKKKHKFKKSIIMGFYEVDCDDKHNDVKKYPNFVPKKWTDCYELPLYLSKDGNYAYDNHDTMSLSSFNYKYDDCDNYINGEEERIKKIVAIINGDVESNFDPDWSVDEDDVCRINYKGEYQFLVRGWGHLTGSGNAMNLPVEIAEKMQDEFITYIINRLNGAKNN